MMECEESRKRYIMTCGDILCEDDKRKHLRAFSRIKMKKRWIGFKKVYHENFMTISGYNYRLCRSTNSEENLISFFS